MSGEKRTCTRVDPVPEVPKRSLRQTPRPSSYKEDTTAVFDESEDVDDGEETIAETAEDQDQVAGADGDEGAAGNGGAGNANGADAFPDPDFLVQLENIDATKEEKRQIYQINESISDHAEMFPYATRAISAKLATDLDTIDFFSIHFAKKFPYLIGQTFKDGVSFYNKKSFAEETISTPREEAQLRKFLGSVYK